MMRTKTLLVFFLGLLLSVQVAVAQPPREDAPPPPRPDAPEEPFLEGDLNEKDVRELVEVLRFAKMAKALGLSKAETLEMMQTFDAHREEAAELTNRKRQLVQDLKESVRESGTARTERTLDALVSLDRELATIRIEAFESMGEGLTTEQRAKLYVFMTEFEGEIRRMVQRARHGMGDERRGPRARPAQPGDAPRREGDRPGPPPQPDGAAPERPAPRPEIQGSNPRPPHAPPPGQPGGLTPGAPPPPR